MLFTRASILPCLFVPEIFREEWTLYMTDTEVSSSLKLTVIHQEDSRELSGVYCCDLLSVAMARAKPDSAWVTVIGNANAVAVANLTDVACIILAEGYSYDEAAVAAAKGKVSLYRSESPVFDTAYAVNQLL